MAPTRISIRWQRNISGRTNIRSGSRARCASSTRSRRNPSPEWADNPRAGAGQKGALMRAKTLVLGAALALMVAQDGPAAATNADARFKAVYTKEWAWRQAQYA